MLKILECDVDGVLLNIWEPVEKVLQQRHRNCDFTFEKYVTTFDMSELGVAKTEVLDLLLSAEIRSKAPFFQGAETFVKELCQLCEKNDMVLVFNTQEKTKQSGEVKRAKMQEFLERVSTLYPYKEESVYINVQVGGRKEMLNSFIVIDDAIPNLLLSEAKNKLLFDRFHNKEKYNAPLLMQSRTPIIRVKNYKDVVQQIKVVLQ